MRGRVLGAADPGNCCRRSPQRADRAHSSRPNAAERLDREAHGVGRLMAGDAGAAVRAERRKERVIGSVERPGCVQDAEPAVVVRVAYARRQSACLPGRPPLRCAFVICRCGRLRAHGSRQCDEGGDQRQVLSDGIQFRQRPDVSTSSPMAIFAVAMRSGKPASPRRGRRRAHGETRPRIGRPLGHVVARLRFERDGNAVKDGDDAAALYEITSEAGRGRSQAGSRLCVTSSRRLVNTRDCDGAAPRVLRP